MERVEVEEIHLSSKNSLVESVGKGSRGGGDQM